VIYNKKQHENTPNARRYPFNIKKVMTGGLGNFKKLSRLDFSIIVGTIIIVVASFFWFFYIRINDNSNNKNPISIFNLSEESKNKILDAEKKANLGDYELGQATLDDVAKSQTSNIERSYVYIKQSVLASNNARYDDAIKYAKLAEDTYQSRLSAINYARVAEKAKNRSLALKYYKLVIERTTEQEKNISIEDYEYYQSKVKEFTN
jgi:hypothetical protein